MIVDFTITNFRSIKDEQTFSLYAQGAPNHLPDNMAYPADKKIGVLRTSGIYGANASGKSNLLLGFEALRHIACGSGNLDEGDKIVSYEPYRLSSTTIDAPTAFEVEFYTHDNVRFIYSIVFNASRIIQESLDFYPSVKKANLFFRDGDKSWQEVRFGNRFKGGRKQYAFFANNSYLSKAGKSADSPAIIRQVYNYLRQNILHLGLDETIQMRSWKESSEQIKKISDILSKVDVGISGIEFRERNFKEDIEFAEEIPSFLREHIISDLKKKELFSHKTQEGEVEKFDKNLESAGTIKFYEMLPLLMSTFKEGKVLLLDELDNSFHPHLAELIINLFNDPMVNCHHAQLIFSTHNINLMSPELLRRDQIWFSQKTDGATTFYSLDEYDKNMVKSNSPYSKWYDEGRFDAIPKIDVGAIAAILRGA